jgi:aminomethyltransferase
MVSLKKTPLNSIHHELGARLVDFAGWEMPVDYGAVVAEHLAVRTAAGLFDVSHMGELLVEGAGALGLLQRLTPNDVSRLAVGQAQYTALTTPEGCFVDDLIIYRLGDSSYLAVVNAANIEKDLEWIESHRRGEGEVTNVSDRYALIALQGPCAPDILGTVTTAGLEGLESLKSYHFIRGDVAGLEAIICRTGYTGEDGFELLIHSESAEAIWRRIMEAGAAHGLRPAGLGARDTLRLEAKMALYGNDIDEEHTVLEADLAWLVKLDKGDFIGRGVLARQDEEGIGRKLVGFEMSDRGIARSGYPVLVGGKVETEVTSGSFAPYLRKAIGLCYLPPSAWSPGSEIEIDLRGRSAKARVVPTPFYKRKKARAGKAGSRIQ